MRLVLHFLIFYLLMACSTRPEPETVYQSKSLQILKLQSGLYQHISYIQIPDYGPFPCNGAILLDQGEALVFDSPVDDFVALELIQWIESQELQIKGIVINHFHEDCLGGLQAFHQHKIPSYAHQKTIELAAADRIPLPQNGFVDSLIISVGQYHSINRFVGPGHTQDNIVSYFPEHKTLFGGCLIKSLGAKKGNLANADTLQWARSVELIKEQIPEVEFVIPGHGPAGNSELLDYTIKLFTAPQT
ncbi:subclass B1 metallo-beta-lactamase [Croceimicrobium hydrocarbonivorans]|uniref:beta-lactamase n=1 Tax=Croceimicrobium hydrocarbonivorans TaxID=2761580 RepID=A0A7H0VHU0_9FLAO|nr:subclass B1 metallo-beta-lactamase [Croceimicrobium hydrocarbonivorans]QNR25288.1 subclass B1 metallo-beta-lactamase [Croceimicrobium hydrocarbonivorans]